MRTFQGLLIVTLAVMAPAPLAAQQGEAVPPPIDVKVATASSTTAPTGPLIVSPGTSVRIFGSSVPLGGGSQIQIDIVKPSKKTASVNAGITPQGTFTTEFKETDEPGTYAVTANSSDGKGKASTSFKVASAGDSTEFAAALDKALVKLAAESRKTLTAVKGAVASKGDFPDKAKIDQTLAQLDQALGQLPAKMADMNKALADLGALTKKYPKLAGEPRIVAIVQSLEEGREQAEELTAKVEDATGRIPKASGICDSIDTAAEALGFMSLVFDLFGKWPVKAAQILTDKVLPDESYNFAVSVENRTANTKATFTESLKGVAALFVGGAAGAKDFVKGPFGLAFDGVQFLTGLGFDKLCERFVGPIDGLFTVDTVATVNGVKVPSWGYKTYLKGRMILRFEKKQATGNTPVPLTGEFEGTATKFEMYEDLFVVNKFNKASVLYRKLQVPVAAGETINWLAAKAGRIATAYSVPHYFLVPITGTLSGDELTIVVGATSRFDFLPGLKGIAHYVWSPPGALFPAVQKFDLQMQNAQFILSRALRAPARMKVLTEKKGTQGFLLKSATQTFTREEVVSGGEVTVRWKVNVKACNPECQ